MAVNFSPTPSRYTPVVTYGLLGIGFLITMFAMVAGKDAVHDLTLSYNDGPQPLQWLVSPFVHTDMIQFASCAIFVAAFGLMVEGRIGPGPFLVFFLAISISSAAVEQIVLQGTGVSAASDDLPEVQLKDRTTPLTAEEKRILAERAKRVYANKDKKIKISPGASAVVFGLIAIFLVLDPSAKIVFGSNDEGLEIPLIVLVVLFIVAEGVKWFLSGFSAGGPVAHLIGAVPGLAIGGLIKSTGMGSKGGGEVSASDLDDSVIAVETKRPMSKAEKKAQAARKRLDREEAKRDKELLLRESAHIERTVAARPKAIDPVILEAEQAIKDKKYADAFRLIEHIPEPEVLSGLTREGYDTLFKVLANNKQWPVAAILLEKSVVAHAEDDSDRRLQLAQILLGLKESDRCQKNLAKINRNTFTPEQKKLYRSLVVQLRRLE